MERCYVINKLCLMFCDPWQQGFLATYVILGVLGGKLRVQSESSSGGAGAAGISAKKLFCKK